jgi:hypothetical protein
MLTPPRVCFFYFSDTCSLGSNGFTKFLESLLSLALVPHFTKTNSFTMEALFPTVMPIRVSRLWDKILLDLLAKCMKRPQHNRNGGVEMYEPMVHQLTRLHLKSSTYELRYLQATSSDPQDITTLLMVFSVNHTNFNKNAISFYS